METSLFELARLVEGTVCGNPQRAVRAAAAFEDATADDITYAALPRLLKNIDATAAGAVIVPADFSCDGRDLIRVANPAVAFARVMARLHPRRRPPAGVSPMAAIGAGCRLGDGVSIAAFVFLGCNVRIGSRTVLHPHVFVGDNVQIGEDVEIHPNVTIGENCSLGDRVTVHAGTVIGSDGYGYAQEGSRHHKIPQIGSVRIDDDVEIGACNTIDRAMFGETWLKRGVKTDNLVHIAHNVTVGQDCLLVAQVGLSGSTTLGDNVVMAGKASTIPHVTIGDRAVIGAKAAVAKSVMSGEVISGTPGMPHRQWLRVQRVYGRLPELNRKVTELEKRLDALSAGRRTEAAQEGGEE